MTVSANTGRVVVIGALLALAGGAHADIINIQSDSGNSTSGLGTFMGSVEYNFDSGNQGDLTIKLTNTSPVENGGYITGLVFNIGGSDAGAVAPYQSGDYPFSDASGQNANPFGGPFDAGAALGGDWEGGGNPTLGVPIGSTGTFNFTVTAADAATLLADDFINGGGLDFNFIVRFRGFNNEGSDKVPVPAPGAAALLGIAALGASRRRR